MHDLKLTTGDRIRTALAKRDIRQRQIADLLGLTQPTICLRLNGTSPWPTHELLAVASHWDIPILELLGRIR